MIEAMLPALCLVLALALVCAGLFALTGIGVFGLGFWILAGGAAAAYVSAAFTDE